MLFNSYEFLFVFLPFTLAGFFFIAGRTHAGALVWLTFASIVFYAWWNPWNIPILVISVLFNYAASRSILYARSIGRTDFARNVLIAAVTGNLVAIAYFKYAVLLLKSAASVFSLSLDVLPIELPIGISFFTFTQIAFLVDTYRGEVRDFNLLRYSLFVTYFPHLIAGPILHHRETMRQFSAARMFTAKPLHFAVGLSIFSFGLAKKVLIADDLASYATPLFQAASQGMPLSFLDAWLGSIAYGLQIYFDFSGYSDMAIGLSYLFGVRVPLNFNSPYQALNIIEFWRRWHMSLSRFLRDYLYFNLGGNRLGPMRQKINLMLTMLLGGLWHGAGWNFVIWGGLHGCFLMVAHGYRSRFPVARFGRLGRLAAWGLTFACVTMAWVFFRADTLTSALRILSAMAGANGIELPISAGNSLPARIRAALDTTGFHFDGAFRFNAGSWSHGLVVIGISATIALLMPNVHRLFRRFRPAIEIYPLGHQAPLYRIVPAWRPNVARALLFGTILVLGLMRLTRPSTFLYFQF